MIDFIKEFSKDTELKKEKIGKVIFSEGTYEVEIKEPKKKSSFWPFLQMNDQGEILDSFCSCEEEEKYCSHRKAAYLYIMEKKEPLHVRYKNSFWHQIFFWLAQRVGFEAKIQKEGKNFSCEEIFLLKALSVKTEKWGKEIFSKLKETEENSIKFSNLSLEELALWKKGQASLSLRFELSFWSDLAKDLFFLQEENKPYQVRFIGKEDVVFEKIQVTFLKDFSFTIFSSEVGEWVESLNTIISPLKVFGLPELIEEIVYEPKEGCFSIHKRLGMEENYRKGKEIDGWIFVPDVGFYSKNIDPIFEKEKIFKEEMPFLFSTHLKMLERLLKGSKIQREKKRLQYKLFFDEEKNFHIHPYVLREDDLLESEAQIFDHWVYLPEKGFFPIEEGGFLEKTVIVPPKELSVFLSKHKEWLQNFKEFQVHFGSVPTFFTYSWDQQKNLVFDTKISAAMEVDNVLDLGEWVFIPKLGFFLKKSAKILSFTSGSTVAREKIGSFIEAHKEELEEVQKFFTDKKVVEKIGLKIRLNEEDRICISLEKKLFPDVSLEDLEFFDSYGYCKSEGFFPLPETIKYIDKKYRNGFIVPKEEEAFFVQYEKEALAPWILDMDPRLKTPENLVVKVQSLARERSKGKNVYLADLIYLSELGRISAVEVWEALQEHKKMLFSSAGLLWLKDARFLWLKNLKKNKIHQNKKLFRLQILEWLRLCIFEKVQEPLGIGKEEEKTRNLIESLKEFETDVPLHLQELKSSLRPYQEIGVKWLWFLYCNGLSGLLCDDMGLGKTHQAMALLAAILEENTDRRYKYLVICPTSVIYHWQDLLQKFLPSIRVHTYHGTERSLDLFEKDFDLLLTSYGIVRTEKELFKNKTFEVAIFDEVQIAKNHASKTNRALRAIEAHMKLGLTGTPIENYLKELKALFDLVLPGYLPMESVFHELFISPIEKQQNQESKKLLSKLIKPFILRRKKSEVLLDLPEKIEEIAIAELSEEQKKMYREVVLTSRQTMVDLKNKEKPINYVHIFSIISNLKRICDHPALVRDDRKNYQKYASGKWDLFEELLQEARESGQKVVVFSQYLGMLEIIENDLRKKGIGFAGIKGSTRDRKAQVQKFFEDPKCEVFVASLLAAGLGINLSAGSVVIHYDRWWNPAKENQATDRVHRIGQNRGVQVFKLVTKNTIEEHIHQLIEKKKGLIEETLGSDESNQVKVFSRDELIALMQRISQDVKDSSEK